MEKESEILITFGELEETTSKEIFQAKLMSLYEIEEACQSYNSNSDYLQVLTNILHLAKKLEEVKEDEFL